MEIVFNNPIMLLLLLLIPIMIVLHYYFFEHTKKKAMKFANFSAMKRVTGTHLITRNTLQLILRVVTLVAIVISVAQPVIWYNGDISVNDYVIAIDASASMVSEDVLPDRLTVAKRAATAFIDEMDAETRVGLISFSGVSFIKKPLTEDLRSVKEAISLIEVELSGGTDIGGALVTATNLLAPVEKSKSIILITDGSDTSGSFVDESIQTGLEYVTKNHILVHTIGVGSGLTKAGYLEGTDLRAEYKKNTLEDIAKNTGGKFFEVGSSAEMAAAFQEINAETEKGEIPFELSFHLIVTAFLLLFVEWGLLNTRFRAIP